MKVTLNKNFNPIGTKLQNLTIKGFAELRYFTSLKNEREMFKNTTFGTIELPEGLSKVPHSMFRFSQGENVIIPSSVTAIDELSFNSARIKNLVFKGDTLIEKIYYWGILYARIENLYVAPHLVEKYKQSSIWDSQKMQGHLGNILPLSEYHS